MNDKTITALREQLKAYRGSLKEVEQLSGVSRETVRLALINERQNTRVYAAAAQVLREKKKERPIITPQQAQQQVHQAVA